MSKIIIPLLVLFNIVYIVYIVYIVNFVRWYIDDEKNKYGKPGPRKKPTPEIIAKSEEEALGLKITNPEYSYMGMYEDDKL